MPLLHPSCCCCRRGRAQAATPRDALVMAWNLDALITFDPAQIGEVNGNDIIRNVCDPLVQLRPEGRVENRSEHGGKLERARMTG